MHTVDIDLLVLPSSCLGYSLQYDSCVVSYKTEVYALAVKNPTVQG